jgi:HK97 family phage prohead protease
MSMSDVQGQHSDVNERIQMVEHIGWPVEIRQVDDPSRVISFIGVSAQEAVRDRLFLVPRGARLENYRRNPVFLWAHDYREPAIGRALDIRVRDTAIEFDIEFAGRDVSPFADVVYQLYRRRFMRAVSVGWITLESEREELPDGRTRIRITKWDLLELSAVPVPADPGAVSLSGLEDLDRELVTRALHSSARPPHRTWQRNNLEQAISLIEEVMGAEEKDGSLGMPFRLVERVEALEVAVAELEAAQLTRQGGGDVALTRPATVSPEELAAVIGRATEKALNRLRGRLD